MFTFGYYEGAVSFLIRVLADGELTFGCYCDSNIGFFNGILNRLLDFFTDGVFFSISPYPSL